MTGKQTGYIGFLIVLISLTCAVGVYGSEAVGPESSSSPAIPSATSSATWGGLLNPRLGEEKRLSSTADPEMDNDHPAAAYGSLHDEYLVVWRSNASFEPCKIMARLVTSNGEMYPSFAVFADEEMCWSPSVTYNAEDDVYSVVWVYDGKGDHESLQIWARVVSRKGELVSKARRIASADGMSYYLPRVVWLSGHNRYAMVWSVTELEMHKPSQVRRAELSSKLEVLNEVVVTSGIQPRDADIAYDSSSDASLVVWKEGMPGGDTEIGAAQYKGSPGELVDPPGAFPVHSVEEASYYPRVATNHSGRYLVARHLYPTEHSPWDTWGVMVDLLDGSGSWESSMRLWTGSDMGKPFVMADPGSVDSYFVLMETNSTPNTAIKMKHFGDTISGHMLQVSAREDLDYSAPVGAMGAANMLLVYEGIVPDDPLADRHVYARICSTHNTYVPMLVR